jgi:hypothetical protein
MLARDPPELPAILLVSIALDFLQKQNTGDSELFFDIFDRENFYLDVSILQSVINLNQARTVW